MTAILTPLKKIQIEFYLIFLDRLTTWDADMMSIGTKIHIKLPENLVNSFVITCTVFTISIHISEAWYTQTVITPWCVGTYSIVITVICLLKTLIDV